MAELLNHVSVYVFVCVCVSVWHVPIRMYTCSQKSEEGIVGHSLSFSAVFAMGSPVKPGANPQR